MKSVKEAAVQLESVLLRQMLRESGAFKSESAGSHVYADFLVDAVADAVSKSGGLGVAKVLEGSLGGAATEAAQARKANMRPALAPPAPEHNGVLEALVASDHARISSGFGARRDPVSGRHSVHHGVDIAAPLGSPIRAVEGGTVTFAGENGGYGLMVEVDHGDGRTSRYAHAQSLQVKVGDRVDKGDTVAAVGNTGRSTGPHLHLEVREHGQAVDPHTALQISKKRVED